MPIPNEKSNSKKIGVFIDFIPAELRQTKDWIIVYYCKNPLNDKLERQRIRVPKLKSHSERIKLAKKMVLEINSKLADGWLPFINETGKNFKTWNEAIKDFRNYLDKLYKDNSLRFDSIRTYKSNLNLLEQFILNEKAKITFVLQFNKSFCFQYLDWIYLVRKNSPRTRNNHLIFLRLLGNYFLQRGILAENPTAGIKNLQKTTKKRIYIPDTIRNEIKKELILQNNGFYCLCMMIYYCLIRNTELRKLKVKFIDIDSNSIFIPKEISKNKKDETVTIPGDYKIVLQKHLIGSCADDFLFSNNDFFAGAKQMSLKKIHRKWESLREKLNFKKEYQFYSLKDTGITNLFLLGLPAIKIKNQARHSTIQITELYTPSNIGCDDFLRQIENNF